MGRTSRTTTATEPPSSTDAPGPETAPGPAAGLEELWRALFENVPDAITQLAPDGRIVLANRAAEGHTVDTQIGLSLYDTVPPFLQRPLRAAVEEVVRTGERRSYETRLPTPEGDAWWSTRFIPLREGGRVTGVLLIASEFTAERRAQQALRESEERLQLALDGARDGVWDWDVPSGRAIYSEHWTDMLGYAPDEVEPDVQAWLRLVHPDDLPRAQAAMAAHFAGDSDRYEVEHRLRTRDGGWKWVLTRGRVMARDAEGRPVRMTGTHKDISQDKAADEERERLIRELESALAQVKTLSGLLPICGWCKSVRDDRGYWERIEAFIARHHADTQFTHGICPGCAERLKLSDEPG